MQMQVRIKASDDFNDRLALSKVGGRYSDSPYPVFIFINQAQRQEYDRIRRQQKEAKGDVTPKGNPEAKAASRKYRTSREFRI
ncbi:hypothetical protein [Paenibacillus xylanexedens]|uniref:Uncharacterized protein n=1 Tax=Paenibacillus xylanexedens TaxID=528191 RepID=A0ABS4RR22_PAEXY|nr:hypothetical protein [Paenibacillus xylanexedens]MBP2245331.1 hypothetical protein [Paenibacillus xylanexedens]